MKKIPDKIYKRIDNEIYNTDADTWWQPGTFLNLIRTVINPFRLRYARKAIDSVFRTDPSKLRVLEVGCGGGLFSEEFARLGYITTGIDPSGASLNTAILHAKESNLDINYLNGTGENIPFPDNSFDIVLCCDVLEHVYDLPKVISEISRVLKDGGLFIYDTFNRTTLSKISVIKILQEWKRWAVMPAGLHVWKMFIKPSEIKVLLSENQLLWQEHTGIKPDIPYPEILGYLRRRASGNMTNEELSTKFKMTESKSISVMYMGYALKDNRSTIA